MPTIVSKTAKKGSHRCPSLCIINLAVTAKHLGIDKLSLSPHNVWILGPRRYLLRETLVLIKSKEEIDMKQNNRVPPQSRFCT